MTYKIWLLAERIPSANTQRPGEKPVTRIEKSFESPPGSFRGPFHSALYGWGAMNSAYRGLPERSSSSNSLAIVLRPIVGVCGGGKVPHSSAVTERFQNWPRNGPHRSALTAQCRGIHLDF